MIPILAMTANTGETIGLGVLTLGLLAMAIATIPLHRPRSVTVAAFVSVLILAAMTAASANGVVFTTR